ncbi:hypothetical protein B0H14DRAFT_3505232 [Mycena olivaceomarginata]|nr:hypothetical protein B0H14DRAFT_3505232 [Mycena olivaceomarginata]
MDGGESRFDTHPSRVDNEGNLVRNGTVEDTELDVVVDDLPLAVRRPKRDMKVPVPHDGEHMWVQ